MRSKRLIQIALMVAIPLVVTGCGPEQEELAQQGGTTCSEGAACSSASTDARQICSWVSVGRWPAPSYAATRVNCDTRDVNVSCSARLKLYDGRALGSYNSPGGLNQCESRIDSGGSAVGSRHAITLVLWNPDRRWTSGYGGPRTSCNIYRRAQDNRSTLHCEAVLGSQPPAILMRLARRHGIDVPNACAALSDKSWEQVKPDSPCIKAAQEVWRQLPEAKKQVLLGGR